MSEFDRHEVGAEAPTFVQHALLVDSIFNELNQKLARIPAGDRGKIEVVKWLMSYLENRISHAKAGTLRREIIVRLLREYYRTEQQLGEIIDFVHGEGLIKRRNALIRLCCICGAYLRYKLL